MTVQRAVVIALVMSFVLAIAPLRARAESAPLELSPETRELLRTEMREVTRAMQDLVEAIAKGRWDVVAELGKQIAASFVLERELSAKQRQELETVLPAHFKWLDRSFHSAADKLRLAAEQHDPELVTFRMYQLLSDCTACHAEYARAVFTGYGIRNAERNAPEQ